MTLPVLLFPAPDFPVANSRPVSSSSTGSVYGSPSAVSPMVIAWSLFPASSVTAVVLIGGLPRIVDEFVQSVVDFSRISMLDHAAESVPDVLKAVPRLVGDERRRHPAVPKHIKQLSIRWAQVICIQHRWMRSS